MTRSRAIAAAIVRRAEMRAALQHLAWNSDRRLTGVITGALRAAARILRHAADHRRIRLMPGRPPIRGPFPDVADQNEHTETERRKRRHRRGSRVAILVQ